MASGKLAFICDWIGRRLLQAVACICIWAWIPQAISGPLKVQDGRLVDQVGADVVLRGFNLSQWHKIPPFRPNQDPELFSKLSLLGVNAVRLQFNWEAYELKPGVYDESYLNYYAGVVARARAQHIYVIVDIHQDVFSRWTLKGCGEGFPKWAIPPGVSVAASPDNGSACATWPVTALLHVTELNTLYNAFMDHDNWVREHYMVLLERLAQRFVGVSNVIGYEPINEPWGAGQALTQLNRDAAERIRRFDPSALIFVCPEMWAGLGIMNTAIQNPGLTNVVFAPHYYDPLVSFKVWLGTRYEPRAQQNRDLARSWGAAVVLGEFGAPPSEVAPRYINMIYNDLERFGESGLQWGYTPEWNPVTFDGFNSENLSVIDNHGQLRNNFTPRPYVRRTAGTYGQWLRSDEVGSNGTITLHQITYGWKHDPARGATELFLPKGVSGEASSLGVMVSPDSMRCLFQDDRQVLRCSSPTPGLASIVLSWRD